MQRRTFLVGGLSGLGLLALSACTTPDPTPSTTATPTPTPTSAIPEPLSFARSSWSSDPFSMGSHSYLPVGATPSDRTALAQSIDGRIFMAGEATSLDRPGTVTGAWLSGIRAAEEVAGSATAGERIAVLGAGMAGAAAARQLVAAGFDVVVLEARDRTGGRVNTITDDAWGVRVELGALVISDVAGSILVGELAAGEVTTALLDTGLDARLSDGTTLKVPEDLSSAAASALTSAQTWAEDQSSDTPLHEALSAVSAPDITLDDAQPSVSVDSWMTEFLQSNVLADTGAGVDDLSGRHGWTTPEDPSRIIVLGGLATVIDNALQDVDVRLSSAVIAVTVTDDAVGLRFATGESQTVDRVVITIPLGVLQSDAIVFDPELPTSHRNAIKSVGVGARETVAVRFDEAFWDSDVTEWSLIDSTATFTQWTNLQPLTGEPVLIGTVSSDEARRISDLDDDAVLAEAMDSLNAFATP